MRPEQYEHHVAAVLRSEGWKTSVTRLSRDMGVDVLAEQSGRRLAVQVKLYGASSTKVNAEHLMCLHGAAAYADCHEAMLATDGRLSADAERVADKLGVEVRHIPSVDDSSSNFDAGDDARPGRSFDHIWERYVEPLAGHELIRSSGKTMQVLEVDGSGVRRVTTGGTTQRITIATFRWVIDRLLAGETVSRREIHERNARQVSSGVMLILSQVPLFELVTVDGLKAIRMRTQLPREK